VPDGWSLQPVEGDPFAAQSTPGWNLQPVEGDPFAAPPAQAPLHGYAGTDQAAHVRQSVTQADVDAIPDRSGDLKDAAPITSMDSTMTEYGPSATTPGVDRLERNYDVTARNIAESARQAWQGQQPFITPQAQQWLRDKGVPDAAISTLNSPTYALAAMNAIMRGGIEGFHSLLEPVVGEQAARDLSAMPEAFPLAGHELGGLGIPGAPRLTQAESAAMSQAQDFSHPFLAGNETDATIAGRQMREEREALNAQMEAAAQANRPRLTGPGTPVTEEAPAVSLAPEAPLRTPITPEAAAATEAGETAPTWNLEPVAHDPFEAPPSPVDEAASQAVEPTPAQAEVPVTAESPLLEGEVLPPVLPYAMFDPRDLTLAPDTFQYKASDERGVTGALRGATRWESALANPITVWQANDGTNYVVNGHQRTDLALRAQAAGQPDVQMPAQVFREADGYTPEYMRALGAYQNISEGSGTAIDAAKVLRSVGQIPESRRLPDLPPGGELVRQGTALAKLSPEAFGMVTNEIVPAAYAAHVGDLISDPTEQLGALQVLARAEPANSAQARIMVQDAVNSGFARGVQGGLFGEEAFAHSLIPERARVLDQALRSLRKAGGIYRAAVEGEEPLTSAGNTLNREGNIQARTENGRLLDILQRDATTRGPISDALSRAATDVASGKPVAGASSRFLSKARQIVRSGSGAGLRPGDLSHGVEHPAASEVDPAAAFREELGPGLFESPVPLFSPVARAVDGLKQARGTGEQMLAQITKTPGVKPEELAWMGLPGWLRDQKSVTKAQIADFVRANQLDVREVTHPSDEPNQFTVSSAAVPGGQGGMARFRTYDEALAEYSRRRQEYPNGYHSIMEMPPAGTQPKYSGYTLPGGSNYRELLITLPPKATTRESELMRAAGARLRAAEQAELDARARGFDVTRMGNLTDATDRARAAFDRAREAVKQARGQVYRSPHWEEPNVLAHVRFDERTAPDGARVLMVHEVQSDMHQAGRKRGYYNSTKPWEVFNPVDGAPVARFATETEARADARRRGDGFDFARGDQGRAANAIPDAPFKTTWPALAMKRIIKLAADNGFDRVAWAPGEVQADRYDLSKHINRLDYVPSENTIWAYDKNDRIAHTIRDVTPENMADKIGKEAAEKLLAQPDRAPVTGPIHEGRMWKRLEGADLKVGGEGMKTFYDKMLPAEVNKITGRFGAKVGTSEIATHDKGPEGAWIVEPPDRSWQQRFNTEQDAEEWARLSARGFGLTPEDMTATFVGKPVLQPVHSLDITPRLRSAVQSEGLGLFAGRRLPAPPPAGQDLFGTTRVASAQRTPEPTIRTDQRQAVMPGMEPSAIQAQAARDNAPPKSNQLAPNEGLFARQEPVQPQLPTRTSRYLNTSPFTDELHEAPLTGHEAAADWVFNRGRDTGHEHVAVVDNRTGEIIHAGTSGLADEVKWKGDNGTDLPPDSLTIHHNHPNGSALSGPDIGMLTNPAISHVVAHGANGTTTVASLVPKWKPETTEQMVPLLRSINSARFHAHTIARSLLQDLVNKDAISGPVADLAYEDVTNRLLHAGGVINYASTLDLAAPIKAALAPVLRNLGHADATHDRYTVAVPPEERTASLPAPVAGDAGEVARNPGRDQNGAGESGTSGERRGGGEGVEGGEATQGSLSAGEPLTPAQRAVLAHNSRNGPLPPREMPNLVEQGPPKPPREARASPSPSDELPLREPPQPAQGHNGGPPMPPDSLWPPDQQPPKRPPPPPEIEAARITAPAATKNLNPVEKLTIFPQTLANLDNMSARLWNSWQARERTESTNAAELRGIIQPNFLKLSKPDRLKVAGALEIARIEGAESLVENPDGTITAHNGSIPHANWSKVGDSIQLTPQQTAAYHEAVQLGRDQWTMLQRAAAKRYGWDGALDPAAIRAEAQSRGEPGDYHRLNRLADLLDVMRSNQQEIYFPMQRFGSYFIAIRPKAGEGVIENLGGHPPLAWFETVEKPAFQDLLGATRGAVSVQARAAKRIAELEKDFPPDKFDYQHGDFARTPQLLRQLNIPAVEKLFMLMENKVKAGMTDAVMRGDNPPTTKQGIREEAKNRYDALHGSTLEAFYDALFEELKSGYRRRAKVVPGYSQNFDRAISSHLYQIARNAADTVHRDSIESDYQNIQDYHSHQNVKNYWRDWRAYQEDPGSPLSRAAATMNQIGFAYMLGMNPSSTMIIASHMPMTAAPVLSVGVGPRVAVPALARGLRSAYGALKFDTVHGGQIDLEKAMAGMPPEKQAFLRKMAQEGRLAAVGTHDMAALNDKLAPLFHDHADLARRAMEIATSNVHAVDQANRFAVASAAWDIASNPAHFNAAAAPLMRHNAAFREMVAREMGLSPESYGRFMLSRAAFDWGKANQAPIMRGPLGQLMFALHGFQTRYLSTAFNLMKNSGPEGRLGFYLMMAALFAGAGAFGLPFSQDALKGADEVYKHFTGRDPALKFKIHDFIQDHGFGEAGADILLDGAASYGTGINLGSRIGFGDVLQREFESTNVLGTIPSIAWNAYSGASLRYESGQPAAAVAAEAVPAALRGPLRALAASQQGIVSRQGIEQVPPENISKADIAKIAAGFQPLVAQKRAEETQRYIAARSPDAWRDMIRNGQQAEAIKQMKAAGWTPGRVEGFIFQAHRPPGPGVQFRNFERNRTVAPPP
jgi:hypothetical protein